MLQTFQRIIARHDYRASVIIAAVDELVDYADVPISQLANADVVEYQQVNFHVTFHYVVSTFAALAIEGTLYPVEQTGQVAEKHASAVRADEVFGVKRR